MRWERYIQTDIQTGIFANGIFEPRLSAEYEAEYTGLNMPLLMLRPRVPMRPPHLACAGIISFSEVW